MRCSKTLYLSYDIASAAKKGQLLKVSVFGALRTVVKTSAQRSGNAEIHIQCSNHDFSASAEMRTTGDCQTRLEILSCLSVSLFVDLSNLYKMSFSPAKYSCLSNRNGKKNNMELMSDELLQDNDTMRHNNDEQ